MPPLRVLTGDSVNGTGPLPGSYEVAPRKNSRVLRRSVKEYWSSAEVSRKMPSWCATCASMKKRGVNTAFHFRAWLSEPKWILL